MSIVTDYNAQLALFAGSLEQAQDLGARAEAEAAAERERAKSEAAARDTAAREEFDRLTAQDATFLFVTNEIGLGGVSENKIQRRFTDLQGWMNQYIAERADEVVLMVSGIPVKVK